MENHSPEGVEEQRAVMSAADQNDLPEPGGEQRDQPTPEDWKVAQGLKELKGAVSQVKADQLMDPDNKTDPDDEAVSAALDEIEAAVDKAIVAQGKDKKWEPEESKSGKNWATAKRAFSSLMEQPPAHTGEIQVRLDGGEDSPVAHFVGYASTTGVPYSVRDWLGEYTETILPGAFAKTLREQGNVPLLFNHDGIPLASTGSGTSRLSEDAKGLRNEADLDRRDALTNSICVQLQRGVLDKMSFSFRATKDTWNDAYDDRGVNEAALYDSSVVTYPANPATSAELVDSMRSALGREGRSLWLADSELSVRSLLPVVVENRSGMPDEGDDLLEKAFRALVRADEVLCRSHGPHGRSRTFRVAEALMELRAGKALSSKNQTLLQQAADALASADRTHQQLADHHASAAGKIQSVLDAAGNDAASQDGKSNGTPPGNGNPIMPQDGAGPRSARALQLKRQREAELRALRGA